MVEATSSVTSKDQLPRKAWQKLNSDEKQRFLNAIEKLMSIPSKDNKAPTEWARLA